VWALVQFAVQAGGDGALGSRCGGLAKAGTVQPEVQAGNDRELGGWRGAAGSFRSGVREGGDGTLSGRCGGLAGAGSFWPGVQAGSDGMLSGGCSRLAGAGAFQPEVQAATGCLVVGVGGWAGPGRFGSGFGRAAMARCGGGRWCVAKAASGAFPAVSWALPVLAEASWSRDRGIAGSRDRGIAGSRGRLVGPVGGAGVSRWRSARLSRSVRRCGRPAEAMGAVMAVVVFVMAFVPSSASIARAAPCGTGLPLPGPDPGPRFLAFGPVPGRCARSGAPVLAAGVVPVRRFRFTGWCVPGSEHRSERPECPVQDLRPTGPVCPVRRIRLTGRSVRFRASALPAGASGPAPPLSRPVRPVRGIGPLRPMCPTGAFLPSPRTPALAGRHPVSGGAMPVADAGPCRMACTLRRAVRAVGLACRGTRACLRSEGASS
jgi:hypothetical protein